MAQYIWLIPLLPLIGFFINGLGRNHLPKNLIASIGSFSVLGSFIISLIVFFTIPTGENAQPIVFKAFDLINILTFHVPFAFQIDALTSLFLLIITGIGFLIHVYSAAYMVTDKGYGLSLIHI